MISSNAQGRDTMKKSVIIWALVVAIAFCARASAFRMDGVGLDDKLERASLSSLNQIASEIKGAIIYCRYRQVYKIVIGDWEPIELGEGEYARWSKDGKKIAVYVHRKVYVMNADGSDRKLVTGEGWSKHGCPIEFHANCREIIFIRRGKRGLWTANINNGEMRLLTDLHDYGGEPGMSADGTRMVARVGGRSYALDLAGKTDFQYVSKPFACSSGISPDGEWLMNNRMGHKGMDIRSWDRKEFRVLRASICQPDAEWDNHHWSNHNDYICAQGGKIGETYVIKVSARRGTRVTWVGKTVYPDLYVESEIQDSASRQNSRMMDGGMSQCTAAGTSQNAGVPVSLNSHASGLGWWILSLLPAATDVVSKPPVALVNEDYSRLTARVLILRVQRPTRANLDYAAYDSNVMHYDPTMYEPNPPPVQTLSDLHFDGTLVPESLTDRLSATPLTPAEKAAPMAWLPLTEYLMDWEFDPGYKLAEAGWKISEDTWNDHRIPRDYQEITRVYIHRDEDDTHDLWVRVEFKPWVKFLKDVDDEDKDGFQEIYGMMDNQLFSEELIKKVLTDYAQKVLSPDEITEWGADLGADWYDKYNTTTLKSEQIKVWPNAQTEPEVKAELGDLVLEQPDVVVRGKPFGKMIYNVFLTGTR